VSACVLPIFLFLIIPYVGDASLEHIMLSIYQSLNNLFFGIKLYHIELSLRSTILRLTGLR